MSTVQLVENGHLFVADEYDPTEVNIWIMDEGYHNGPLCRLCLECWCEHCEPGRFEELCPDLVEPGLFPIDDLGPVYQAWKENNGVDI